MIFNFQTFFFILFYPCKSFFVLSIHDAYFRSLAKYYATKAGTGCGKGFNSILNTATCNRAAKEIAKSTSWKTQSTTIDSALIPGNVYTRGCYWNTDKDNLWFNPYYGVDGACHGPQDCQTLCEKSGILETYHE